MKTHNTDIISQVDTLETILRKNPIIERILENVERLELPQWYLGAGCIAQTVWNYLSKKELTSNINDYDLAYFDADELSYDSENEQITRVRDLFDDLPVKIDVKNQARIHLWYKEHFGRSIEPYRSVEEAINTWPATATCVGVKHIKGKFKVYAPFGLNDMFGMLVRPNKLQITEDIYVNKVNRWKQCWPELKFISW
jgi:hypothetical protein